MYDKLALRQLAIIGHAPPPGIIFFPGFRKLMTSYNKIVVILLVGGMGRVAFLAE